MTLLITSALPYANGPIHFGHIAGAYLPGDCYARFQRLLKKDVLYICGSDEYGVAITMSAETAKRTPKEHVDIYHEVIKNFFEKLNFSFDHYSRTTSEKHAPLVQQFFTQLLENGYIEEKVTDQLYSESDKRFLADRYVVGTCPKCGCQNARGDECPECGASYDSTDLKAPRSKLTNSPLTLVPTQHWFLRLDLFKEKLMSWVEQKNWKPNVANFVKGYIQELHPRSITRDSNWGVPIPLSNTEGKVLYVWFDAPIGYISATIEWAEKIGNKDKWKDYWQNENVKLVHFIGKDNIPFHGAIFPAMIMGQNEPFKLVDELPANEFYKFEGRQFSKSDGWYIDLDDFFTRYTADQIRYTIAANAPETADSEFTWKDFLMRCNTELLGKYGNFANRTLVFAKNKCHAEVPPMGILETVDMDFLKEIDKIVAEAKESYDTYKMRRGSQLIMELAQAGNVYFDGKHPWKDAKSDQTKGRMETTIACCLHCLKALALISYPIIPETATKLFAMIGCPPNILDAGWDAITKMQLNAGQTLAEPEILFQKVEESQINEEIEKLSKLSALVQTSKPQEYKPLKPSVDIDVVQQLDLRIGAITKAEPVNKSKKLLQLEVDIGIEKRNILSGISRFYKPHELIGKKVVVVANLKPATLMGIESQGMLLAGSLDEALELLSVQELAPGAVVS